MQNTEGGGKYPKKIPPHTKCMEGEERGLSSGERRHGVRCGRCIMLGVSNWAPISPPVLGRLLFLAAPLTNSVPAPAFVGLVLVIVIRGRPSASSSSSRPLLPLSAVCVGTYNNKNDTEKKHTIGSKNAYDVSWVHFPCGTVPPVPSSCAVPTFDIYRSRFPSSTHLWLL